MCNDRGQISIVASYNVGLFLKGQRLPNPGETVIADQFFEGGGGKGSNQALAASKLGAQTNLVACIGEDKYGDDALRMYEKFGTNTQYIRRDPTIHTGISVILIDAQGTNLISVAPGANYELLCADIDAAESAFLSSTLVGFQLENRPEVVEYGIKKAHALGTTVLLDPAPARKIPDQLYPCIDIVKPNEHEAEILTGEKVTDVPSAGRAGRWLLDHGVKTAIITLGGHGAVCVKAGSVEHFPAPRVEAVDTTGAGDVFSGALMAALSKGKEVEDAIEFANVAASLSVTKLGVVTAIPELAQVRTFQNDLKEVA